MATKGHKPKHPVQEYCYPSTKKEEAKGFNAGNYKDNEDRYDKNKLVFTAKGSPNMIEELNDDFKDMDEDIGSYRCKCWDL